MTLYRINKNQHKQLMNLLIENENLDKLASQMQDKINLQTSK
jgi:hypothetical protein